MPTTTLCAVSAVTQIEPGIFAGTISDRWMIDGKPNGGYLLAMLGRAATMTGAHPHVIAASAHYLRPPEPGPVAVDVEVLRAGRTASQIRARMAQDGKACVAALVTTGELDPDTKPYWDAGLPDRGQLRMDECVRVPGTTPTGLDIPIMTEVDLRLDPATLGFASGRPTGRGELRGWLALPDEEPFDPTSLLYALDSFLPASLDVEVTGWVPSLEITGYVRALPAPGPVQVRHRAHLIDAQRVDESCYVWDRTGRLVAHGTQLAAIRLG